MPVKTKIKEAGELVLLIPSHLSSLEWNQRGEVGFLRKVAEG